MKVIALKPCFIDGVFRKIGDIFEVDEKVKSKSRVPPFKAVTDVVKARAEAAKVKQDAVAKQTAGAIAASGGKAAKDKADALAKELAG